MHLPVAIVGAGPIGLELAVAFKRAGIEYLHFEAKQVGQTMFWWPPQTRWFSSNERIAIAGVPLQTIDQSKATREEYLRYLRTIVDQFDLQVHAYEPVTNIQREGEGFVLTTSRLGEERAYRVGKIILSTGGTATPNRLNVPGEDLPHVSHYMADPHIYFRQKVMIVGGKNSAVEAALRIYNVGAKVAMSYRRNEFNARSIKYWLYPEITGLIKAGKVEAHFNTLVKEITPGGVKLTPCTENWRPTGEELIEVEADFVLLLTGYQADMSLARLAGVELRGVNQIPVYEELTMETNVPGIYVAGTAIGGTQEHYRVFLENCHIHIDRIIASITGSAPPPAPVLPAMPES